MKKVIFMLAFMLMSGLVFANNNETDIVIEYEKISISSDLFLVSTLTNNLEAEIVFENKFGNCTFSYTLYFQNTVTGESYSQSYTHTRDADSESQCRAYGAMHARVHAMFMQGEMNQ